MNSAEVFEQLIRRQQQAELVPFLVQLPKSDIVAIRQKTRALSRELDRFHEIKPGSWGILMTSEQRRMLFLAGLRTFSRKEAFANGFSLWNLHGHSQNEFWQVLECARPTWLADWLLNRAEAGAWQAADYPMLREMEQRQLIAYHPKLLALAVPSVLNTLSVKLNRLRPLPTSALTVVVEELAQDNTLLQRDLLLVFDYATSIESMRAHVQESMPAGWRGTDPAPWHEWNQRYPAQVVSWLDVLPQLAASGHLNRADLLTRCLLSLRRDFRRPLLTWFKELFRALGPTLAERLARQAELVELLAHPLPLVVNFALDHLKTLWAESAFDLAPLLLYADSLVLRPELKTSLLPLLTGLARLVRRHSAPPLAVARLLATALAHPAPQVQERAAKCLAELLGAKKPLLTSEEAVETVAAIGQQAELLGATARTTLAGWLAAAGPAAGADYAPRPAFAPEISAATAIAPVADWHELLFLTATVLRHDDPMAQERWLEGLLRLQNQLPATYPEQLLPYLLQVLPQLKGATEAEAAAIVNTCGLSGHAGLVQALLLGWHQRFARPQVQRVALKSSDPLTAIEQQRLGFAEELLRHGLPLLSTPTHAPAWLAPTALVKRLLAYEVADQPVHPADLALALARLAYAAPVEAAAACALLPGLRHAGLRALLTWLLAATDAPLPSNLLPPQTLLRQFTQRLARLLPTSPAARPTTLEQALPWLWAVAARTRHPEAELPALASLTPHACAGLRRPWQPGWVLQAQSSSYVQRWLPGHPTYTTCWTELCVPNDPGSYPVPNQLLLYSLHAAQPPEATRPNWARQAELMQDFPFLLALLPHCPDALHWQALRQAAVRNDNAGSDLLRPALTSLLAAGPAFGEAATALLALGLTQASPTGRALALEALLAAIAHQRLVPTSLGRTLGHLLAAEFVPLGRLLEGLTQAQTTSPTVDEALHQLVAALLLELPAAPVRHLRQLLTHYADLTARTGHPVLAALHERLATWSQVSTLKKAAAALRLAA